MEQATHTSQCVTDVRLGNGGDHIINREKQTAGIIVNCMTNVHSSSIPGTTTKDITRTSQWEDGEEHTLLLICIQYTFAYNKPENTRRI